MVTENTYTWNQRRIAEELQRFAGIAEELQRSIIVKESLEKCNPDSTYQREDKMEVSVSPMCQACVTG